MALNGHVVSGDVYAWVAVFVLPINSALNPFLYTLGPTITRQVYLNNVQLTDGNLCPLLMVFANSLDPDQHQQNVGLYLESNCLTLLLCS